MAKTRKMKKDPLETLKIFLEKKTNLRIFCVTVPKNVKGEPFEFFQHPCCCKNEGGPFGAIQKMSKKVS